MCEAREGVEMLAEASELQHVLQVLKEEVVAKDAFSTVWERWAGVKSTVCGSATHTLTHTHSQRAYCCFASCICCGSVKYLFFSNSARAILRKWSAFALCVCVFVYVGVGARQ